MLLEIKLKLTTKYIIRGGIIIISKIMDELKNKFKTEELMIHGTEYWIWSLRPVQATLGAGVLSLKRECPVFSKLN
ncbi:MAG: hypothetical protein PHI90_07380 [Clostridia bacterium]|nr:hypothetical protein [Clostridia bacterium]